MTRPALIERMAKAMWWVIYNQRGDPSWGAATPFIREVWIQKARAALRVVEREKRNRRRAERIGRAR